MARAGRGAAAAGQGIVKKLVEPLAKEAEDVAEAVAKTVRKDSRGRIIPDTVSKLPSGRHPSNWHYHGRKFDDKTRWTPKLAKKYPNGVHFTDDGFPDFSPYASHTVTFEHGYVGNTTSDFTDATRMAGLGRKPSGWTWHHHQDTKTMQLVPTDMHSAVRHAGGRAILRG